MTLPIIIIVLISSLLHASWNLLARRQRREVSFFARLLLIILLVGLIPGVLSEWRARSIPLTSWLCMLGSATCLAVYMYGLGRAYQSSDFTVVYPVVRGLPVLLIGVFDVIRARYPSPLGWVGMLILVIGCVLAPLPSFGEIRLRRYINPGILWMLIAALSSLGYNAFDKVGQELVSPGFGSAARYAYFLYALWCMAYWAIIMVSKVPEEKGSGDLGWTFPAIAGLCNFLSYTLVLWAYQIVDQASYVVAFRQISILFGVLTAFIVFKERGFLTRLTGVLLLTGGLVLIGLWG